MFQENFRANGKKIYAKLKWGAIWPPDFFVKYHFQIKINCYQFLITNNYVLNDDLLHKNNAIISLNIKNEEEIKEFNLNN